MHSTNPKRKKKQFLINFNLVQNIMHNTNQKKKKNKLKKNIIFDKLFYPVQNLLHIKIKKENN